MSWTQWILVAACIVWPLVVYATIEWAFRPWKEDKRRREGRE